MEALGSRGGGGLLVEEEGEEFDAVNEAGAGAGEVAVGVEGINGLIADGGERFPTGGEFCAAEFFGGGG